ncbi:MAG: radical SAM protein [Candidatus Cloacimonetes bacterium]|nr:radical SAM protein [Candidatus Cloacimonadota bacterium]
MKILLINPPIREWAKPNIVPLGLGYIASALRNSGHDVEIMDINAMRWSDAEIEGRIRKAEFDIAGIGAIITVYRKVKWLISLLKKYHSSSPVMIGGSVGTSIPEIILQKTAADIVCIGEGEETVIDIVESIEAKRDLKAVDGIWFKGKNGRIYKNRPRKPIADLDVIPFPAWDLFPMDIYLKNPVGAPNRNKWIDGGTNNSSVLSMNVVATRGCPYQCIYCYHDFMGQKYRHRSVENIIAEMKVLNERYGVKYIHFMDDEFCLKKEFIFDFCDGVKRNFPGKITWGCSGRVNLMTEDLIAIMADSGCVLIGYGIESGSQKMLDTIKKGTTVEQGKIAVKLTKEYLGWADCSFMIGIPGENKDTIQETIDFCKEVDLTPEVIFFVTPYPGTELYRMALSGGKIPDEELYILGLGEQGEKIRVNFTEFSDEDLVAIQEQMIGELGAWNKLKHAESR